MGKRFVFYFLFCLGFLLTSCSKKDYVNSLPKNAQLVLSVDASTLVQKADLKNASLPSALQAMVNEPEKVGIDWTKPLYAYLSDNAMGLVAAVKDADDLTDFLDAHGQEFGLKIESDEDYTWASTDMLLIGYNDDQLLAMSIYGDSKVFRQRARKFMEQDAAESFASTPAFQKLTSATSDLRLYAEAGALPESLIGKGLSFLPKDIELSSLSTLLTADFEKGKLQAKAELFSENEKIQSVIKDLSLTLKKLEGTYATDAPQDYFCFGSFRSTPQLMEMLQKNQSIGMTLELLNQVVPVKDLLATMDGDVAFSTCSAGDYRLHAHLTNTDLFKNDSWAHRTGIHSVGQQAYQYENYVFGLKGEDFFLTNLPREKEQAATVYMNPSIKSWENSIKHSYGFLLVDFSQMPSLNGVNLSFLSSLQTAALCWTAPTQFELTVTAENSQENILQSLLKSWMK